MNKLFFISLGASLNRDQLIKKLEAKGAITFWFYNMPNTFFVRSNLSSKQLSQAMELDRTARYIIIHLQKGIDYSGVVPNDQVNLFDSL